MLDPLLQVCVCGCSFSDPGAFKRHEKNCQKGKKCLSSVLTKAKELYQQKKAHVQNASESTAGSPVVDDPNVGLSPDLRVSREHVDSGISQVGLLILRDIPITDQLWHTAQDLSRPMGIEDDSEMSLVQRRPHWVN